MLSEKLTTIQISVDKMKKGVYSLLCAVLVAVIFSNEIVSGSQRRANRMHPFRKGGELESRQLEVDSMFSQYTLVDCTWPSSLSTGAKCNPEEQVHNQLYEKWRFQEAPHLTVEDILQGSRKFCHPSAECKNAVCECNGDTSDEDDEYGDCKTHKSRMNVDCKLEAELVRAIVVYWYTDHKLYDCMVSMNGGEGDTCEADPFEHFHKKYGTTTNQEAKVKMTPDDWIRRYSVWCYSSPGNRECISGKCDCSVGESERECKAHKRTLDPKKCKSEAEGHVQSIATHAKAESEFYRAEAEAELARTTPPTRPAKPPAPRKSIKSKKQSSSVPPASTASTAHLATPVVIFLGILMSLVQAVFAISGH